MIISQNKMIRFNRGEYRIRFVEVNKALRFNDKYEYLVVGSRGLNLCQNDVSETYTGRRRYSSVERRDIDKSKHNRGRFHPSS